MEGHEGFGAIFSSQMLIYPTNKKKIKKNSLKPYWKLK